MRARGVVALLVLLSLAAAGNCVFRRHAPEASSSMEAPAAASSPGAASPQTAAETAAVPDPFRDSVRPVLVRRCAPCHEVGGKMYERLPFDQPDVIASHSEAILRRLKGDDRETLARWLASLPAAPSPQ